MTWPVPRSTTPSRHAAIPCCPAAAESAVSTSDSGADDHHADAHIEGQKHLAQLYLRRRLQLKEKVWYGPAPELDDGVQRLWESPVEIPRKASPGNVRHRMYFARQHRRMQRSE